MSAIPPTRVATTGKPVAIASTLPMPNASFQTDGQQKIVARRYSAANADPLAKGRNSTLAGARRRRSVVYAVSAFLPKSVLTTTRPPRPSRMRSASTKMCAPFSGTIETSSRSQRRTGSLGATRPRESR
jgi:hypothetical protein